MGAERLTIVITFYNLSHFFVVQNTVALKIILFMKLTHTLMN